MTYFLQTIQNPRHRQDLFDRLARLDPGRPPLWGRMTAPRMLAHLCDQMRMPYNEHPSPPIPGVQHYPVMKQLVLYLLPWPKAQIQGPSEAFQTPPGVWEEDLAALKTLVDQFADARAENRNWADHPNFGRMNHRVWGFFSYRHFDHHLCQFGA